MIPKSSTKFLLVILSFGVIFFNSCVQDNTTQINNDRSTPTSQPTALSSPIYFSPTQPAAEIVRSATVTIAHSATESQIVNTPASSSTQTAFNTPTPDLRLSAYYWRNWPVVPTLSAKAIQVFLHGQELGNDLHSFSRIGDCQSVPAIFLGIYDTERYWLGPGDEHLQSTIEQFSGSFTRTNMTVKDGFGVASVLTPLMADPKLCQPNETPMDCEYRLHKPIIAFIAMGTNWKPSAEITFDRYLRQIVDFSIENGIIPVLVTKADNIEVDNLLNRTIAQVAYDYDMPLFNAWAAVQYLPNHGLEQDRIYLTTEAWDTRSFTALKVLDSIWTTLSSLSP